MSNKHEPPATAKPLFTKLLKRLKREASHALWYRHIDWARYLPAEVAQAVKTTHYRKHILFLESDSGLFAHNLHYLKADLIKAITADFPDASLKDIRCKLLH